MITIQGKTCKEINLGKANITTVTEGTIIVQICRNTKGKVSFAEREQVLDLIFPDDAEQQLIIKSAFVDNDAESGFECNYSFTTEQIKDISVMNSFGESLTDTLTLMITDVKVKKYEY